MVLINTLPVEQLRGLLRERGLGTSGRKACLVQRLTDAVGAQEVELSENNVQDQITELRNMMASLMSSIQNNVPISQNGVPRNTSANEGGTGSEREQTFRESQTDNTSVISGARAGYSIKEIAESLPEYDPIKDSTFSVNQFIDRVNSVISAYNWNDKCVLLALHAKLKGPAKLWLDSSSDLYTRWCDLAIDLQREFGVELDEADIHTKMSNAVRQTNETITEYCFRMSALGKRYKLTESSVIKYARDGLRHRDLQTAIAAVHFNSVKHLRETVDDYFKNVNNVKSYEKNKFDDKEKKTDNKDKNLKTKSVTCYNCAEVGHISTNCPKPQKRQRCKDCNKVHPRGEPENCGRRNTVSTREAKCDSLDNVFTKTVIFGGEQMQAFIDTGSQRNLMQRSAADRLSAKRETCAMRITGICGGVRYSNEKLSAQMLIDGITMQVEVFIVNDELLSQELLLGQSVFGNNDVGLEVSKWKVEFQKLAPTLVCQTQNAINDNDVCCVSGNSLTREKLKNFLQENSDVFAGDLSEIGRTDLIEFEIKLDSTKPIAQKPYRVPEPKKQVVAEIIDDLIKNDIICKSESEYASPILLVRKKDGSDRLCVDYRKINDQTRKEVYPMANIEELLQQAARFKYLTTLDLNSGYYQIPVKEDSRKYTAFITTDGLYEFKCMPFGLKNAPIAFQRLMAKIKEKTQKNDMIHYMDDILVGADNEDEMLEKLGRVFESLRQCKLTLNLSKCEFLKQELEFLGHQLKTGSIIPGSAKTTAVSNFPMPTNITHVRKFLGLSGYFRKFVARYASIAEPLRKLLRQGERFEWTDDQEIAFTSLKSALISKPVLTAYDVNKEHQVHTDASSVGLAGVLMQLDGVDWKPVAYYSRATSDNERKFHSYELETLAVVETLERFKYYILGKKIRVVTDCSAIKATMKKKDLIPRIARWLLRIQEFDVEVEHRKQDSMQHVDSLSRAPDEEDRELDTASLKIQKVFVDQNDWLYSMQLQDKDIQQVTERIKAKDKAVMKDFIIENGRLYRKNGERKLWVIPKSLRFRVLHDAHDQSGHLGVERTLEKLRQDMWFARMRNFTKSYINSCVQCAYTKQPGGQKEGEYHFDDLRPIPFNTIHVDHMGPFPRSSQRNEFILVIIDAFTKYVIIRAVRDTSTKNVLTIFNEVFGYLGIPERIISDRGTAFTSRDFSKYCSQYDIKHVQNAVRTPRANGQVERMNRTILSMLRPSTTEDRHWDQCLRGIQWTLNSLKSSATGKTPHELLYGFQPRNIDKNQITHVLREEQAVVRDPEIMLTRGKAAEQIKLLRQNAKQRFDDAHRKPTVYKENDIVLAENEMASTGTSRKLEPKYKGPFVVTAVLGHDRYVIEDMPNSKRKQRQYKSVFASDKLKPWCKLPEEDDSFDNQDANSICSEVATVAGMADC